jgi:glutamate-ammonia-ligase adenylyltransferase
VSNEPDFSSLQARVRDMQADVRQVFRLVVEGAS